MVNAFIGNLKVNALRIGRDEFTKLPDKPSEIGTQRRCANWEIELLSFQAQLYTTLKAAC